MNLIPLLQQAASGGSFVPLVALGLIFVIFYVFIIGPQKKEQKKTQEMISGAQKGDKIITIGGIHGVITSVKENTIILKVDDGCKLEMNRSAIATVLLDEKTKANRLENTPEKASLLSSLFGKKKEKKAEVSDAEKPQPPDFAGESK
ncbi:preprotein translocase subunit YajC [Treponema sp.]|uniref:preprotein translocase subunit YajC n=1 Tax=Treponema sp. TaxID=166 RepID=UPI003FA2093A